MTSEDLTRSRTWDELGPAIGRQFHEGMPFADILEMNIAIKQRDLEPYRLHRERLDAVLWPHNDEPKRVIDLGAGYGAMATFWPGASHVTNLDLPEMLEVQEAYLHDLGCEVRQDFDGRVFFGGQLQAGVTIRLVPFTNADRIKFDGAYLFSAWALTETTPATWEYYIGRAKLLRGAYVIGHERWEDLEAWPWPQLSAAFVTAAMAEVPNGIELVGWNG